MGIHKKPKKAPANAGARRKTLVAAEEWSTGCLVKEDRSFPVQEVHQVMKTNFAEKFGVFDLDEFDARFGEALSTYRSLMAERERFPKCADELKWLEALCSAVDQVAKGIDHFPPRAEGLAHWDRHQKTVRRLGALISSLKVDLSTLSHILEDAAAAIREQSGSSGGAPPKAMRDNLLEWLTETLVELGPPRSKSKAQTCAAEILSTCGIPAPADGGKRQRQRRRK